MNQAPEISCQFTTDPNIIVYHTRFLLCDQAAITVNRGNSCPESPLAELFLSIDGIVCAHLEPYLLILTRAPMFDWADVQREVEKILRGLCASRRLVKEVFNAKTTPRNSVDKNTATVERAPRTSGAVGSKS